jgi:hypothetical protein
VLCSDARSIEVALEVPAAEIRAVRARLADPERALQVTAALEALPEQFAMRVADEGTPLAASRASTDHVRALLDRAELQRRPFLLGWAIDREVALEHAAVLDEQLEDAVVALGAPFALLADSGAGSGPGSARLRPGRSQEATHRRTDEDRHVGKRRARALHRDDERERERESDSEAEPEPARDREPLARPLRGPGYKPRGRSLGDKIEKGARVRVLEGPFAGKVGVVQELDGKGGARVMLGLLAVRLAVKDLAISVERRHRPLLSSSHRRPPSAGS